VEVTYKNLPVYDPDGELKRKLGFIGKIEKRSRSNLAQLFIIAGIKQWEEENGSIPEPEPTEQNVKAN
jgi:hypothetical protein